MLLCPACGFRPAGKSAVESWLLSDENLGAARLDEAGKRIAAGDTLRPTPDALRNARSAVAEWVEPLRWELAVAILAAGVVISPLVPLAGVWWWGRTRPMWAVAWLAAAAIGVLVGGADVN